MKLLISVAVLLTLPCSAYSEAWAVRPDGVGPVKVGMSLGQMSSILGEQLQAPNSLLSADESGECYYISSRKHPLLKFMMLQGRLARVDVNDPDVKTITGIQVGELTSTVEKVYGTKLISAVHQYDSDERYLTVYDPSKRYGIRFETYRGLVSNYHSGTAEAISYVEGCS